MNSTVLVLTVLVLSVLYCLYCIRTVCVLYWFYVRVYEISHQITLNPTSTTMRDKEQPHYDKERQKQSNSKQILLSPRQISVTCHYSHYLPPGSKKTLTYSRIPPPKTSTTPSRGYIPTVPDSSTPTPYISPVPPSRRHDALCTSAPHNRSVAASQRYLPQSRPPCPRVRVPCLRTLRTCLRT